MAEKFVSRRNLRFMLDEVFDVRSLTEYEYFRDHSPETLDMIIETAHQMASELMFPYFKDMDRQPPVWRDGNVYVHPAVKPYIQEMGSGGWINAHMPYEVGGQQVPLLVYFACGFIFTAANYSLIVYPLLTAGAANLIATFGSRELQNLYLDKMFSGQWQGTMALTEPDVGSSLGDLTTQAIPTDQGYYLIKGKKIFISGGDHDAVDNVVNLMLARIKGAPAGVKGISLFVVPQKRVTGTGDLEFNDISCDGIEHKMGYKGCPICQLSMGDNGDCRGYLVGEANRGLSYMFQMMNEERVNVGIAASAKIMAAYYAALEYTQQRRQGRKATEKNPESPQVLLIEHADIRRMLLFQRAIGEGSMSLSLQLGQYLDLIKAGVDVERHQMLVELLVPAVKTYPSEMGIQATSQAIQCLGGYGYCGDFPVEQYYREIRIDPIHEGTTGIQGQDLLGRKVVMKQGQALQLFAAEVGLTREAAQKFSELQGWSACLQEAMQLLTETTHYLLGIAARGAIDVYLANATVYLEMFSIVAVAWQWLKQAVVARQALTADLSANERNFYQGKLATCEFYYAYEWPKIFSLARTLRTEDPVTLRTEADFFAD